MDEQEFISAFGGTKVRLVSADAPFSWTSSQSEGVRHLGRESAPEYEWREPPEAWGEIGEFIEPIVAEVSPGHQYLNTYTTRHAVDDALVVLSKGEYGDELLGTG